MVRYKLLQTRSACWRSLDYLFDGKDLTVQQNQRLAMKQIARIIVGVLMMSSAMFAQAYPACSGTAVSSCSSLTTQSACTKSYMAGNTLPCTGSDQTCNQSTGYCALVPGVGGPPPKVLHQCIVPGLQCSWSSGVCSDGGSQCQ